MPAKTTRYCKFCKKPFYGPKCQVYCSPQCRQPLVPWNKGQTGIAANRPRNGINKICMFCGQLFYVPLSLIGQNYCSAKCYLRGRWGESHKIDGKCIVCGIPFVDYKGNNKICCSLRCSSKHRSLLLQGSRSLLWRGGTTAPYHKEWREYRRQAHVRDNHKCVVCGSTDRLQVHHVIPYRYSHSHEISNLVTLCRSCHSRQELQVNPLNQQALKKGRYRHTNDSSTTTSLVPSHPPAGCLDTGL